MSAASSSACEPQRWKLSRGDATAGAPQTAVRLGEVAAGLAVGSGVRLLGVAVPAGCQPTEAWARGADLTAIYEPGDDRGLRVTAMWRLGEEAGVRTGVCSWQLVLSAQTALLETVARQTVLSSLAAQGRVTGGRWNGDEIAWHSEVGDQAQCVRISSDGDGGECLVIAIHPDDRGVIECTTTDTGGLEIRCQLFPSRVEKGVLLRSRVMAALGPAAPEGDDAGWSAALLQQFAGSKPILTA